LIVAAQEALGFVLGIPDLAVELAARLVLGELPGLI
jgi:hypothetical protein